MGFPCGSDGKESACNAGDLGSTQGLNPGLLHYRQILYHLPVMQETWVQSLGWEDPLEKEKATHSTILAWRIPWGRKESDTTEQISLSIIHIY